MSPKSYPAIRPSAEPPAPGLRAVLAYLWSERLLGTIGDNGDFQTMVLLAVLGKKDETPDDAARRAYGRAVYDVLGSEVFHAPWRDGDTGFWTDVRELAVDYHPCGGLQAVEGVYVAAGYKAPKNYPMKTSSRLCDYGAGDDHVTLKAGYGAPSVHYYPLADGRVLVTGGHAIGTALAEALAAYPDGTFPGVGTLRTDDAPDDDATDTVFDWKAYLGTLGVGA